MTLSNIQTPMFEKNDTRLKEHMKHMGAHYQPFLKALPKAVELITSGAILPVKVAQV